MKVYVTGEAAMFQGEKLGEVYDSQKKAEKAFREKYPHCRKWEGSCGEFNSASDAGDNPVLLFIHEREVK